MDDFLLWGGLGLLIAPILIWIVGRIAFALPRKDS